MLQLIRQIAHSKPFDYFIVFLILFTAVILGIEAFPQIITTELKNKFEHIHQIILALFIIEAIIKITAEWPKPQRYFQNGWNVFDFSIIVFSLLPVTSEFAMLGRILRLLRVVRLITVLPELRLIVETLFRSIPSMLNIMLLMGVMFFIYAVAGFHFFHEQDPIHWRDLGYAVLTLFRIVTLEDWTDVMYKAMELSPWYGFYFVSFVLIGTFIVINLFIAVVINNLENAKYDYLKKLENPDLHDQLLDTIQQTKESITILEKKLELLKEQGPDRP